MSAIMVKLSIYMCSVVFNYVFLRSWLKKQKNANKIEKYDYELSMLFVFVPLLNNLVTLFILTIFCKEKVTSGIKHIKKRNKNTMTRFYETFFKL